MQPLGRPARVPGDVTAKLRHRPTPERVFANKLIVARPSDGAPVVMEADAVLVWRQLDDWTTTHDIDRRLAEEFPDVAPEERVTARSRILVTLQDDELIERA